MKLFVLLCLYVLYNGDVFIFFMFFFYFIFQNENQAGIASEAGGEEEYSEFTSYRSGSLTSNRLLLTQSRTLDSLNEVGATKAGTPSTVSRFAYYSNDHFESHLMVHFLSQNQAHRQLFRGLIIILMIVLNHI